LIVRKWFAAATAAALLAGAAVPAWAAIPARVVVGDVELVSPAPFIEDGRTLVPIETLAQSFSMEVNVSEDGQQVELVRWPKRIALTVGSTTAVVNGKEIQLDVPPRYVDGSLYVPLRFVADALGAPVSWDQETWTATVQPIAPEVLEAWELLTKSSEVANVALKGVGTVITEMVMDAEESLSLAMNVEVLTDGANALSTVTAEGQEFASQAALYEGQFWINLPEQGWIQFSLEDLPAMIGAPANFTLDLNALQQLGEDILAAADVAVTGEEVINGVQTYRVDVDLTNAPLFDAVFSLFGEAPFEGLEMGMSVDKYLISNWIDAEGFTHKMTMDMVMSMTFAEEGQDPITMVSKMFGEFVFEPLTEAIAWPEAILNPAPAEPAEEEPAEEQPAAEQPAEEQPAEEEPAEEQPAEEQPAEEQPAEEQPAEEQPAEEQPAEEQPAE